jgi:hypothetical protein
MTVQRKCDGVNARAQIMHSFIVFVMATPVLCHSEITDYTHAIERMFNQFLMNRP